MTGLWSLVFFFACIVVVLILVNAIIPMNRVIRIVLDVVIVGVIVWWVLHLFAASG